MYGMGISGTGCRKRVKDWLGRDKHGRLLRRPLMLFGDIQLIPVVDGGSVPVLDMWCVPGRSAMHTNELRRLARVQGITVRVLRDQS